MEIEIFFNVCVQVFRKTLTQMFLAMDQDVVFMETCMGLRYHPHMYIECIPMEKETGDLAPIYFKVTILYHNCILNINRIYNRSADSIISPVLKVISN